MTPEERELLEQVVGAVYPEVRHKGGLPADILKEEYEDLELAYCIELSGKKRVYLKPETKQLLERAGIDLKDRALRNFERDLNLEVKPYTCKDVNGGIKILLLFGNLNMGVALLCDKVLHELWKIFGGDFIIIAVYEEFIAVKETAGDRAVGWEIMRDEICMNTGDDALSENMYLFSKGKLTRLGFFI